MYSIRVFFAAALALSLSTAMLAQGSPSVRILLPERTRLLEGQLIDVILEVRNAATVSNLKVTAAGADLTPNFSTPVKAELDCDSTSDYVYRTNLQSFATPGTVKLEVSVTAGTATVTDSRDISVQAFTIPPGQSRNIILFIGDVETRRYARPCRLLRAHTCYDIALLGTGALGWQYHGVPLRRSIH